MKTKVYVKTFGCQSNYSDSERIAGVLNRTGFKIVDCTEKADTIIINSCGVKSVTQNRVVSYANSLPKSKKVFIGGCLPRMLNLKNLTPSALGFFDVNSISKLPLLLSSQKKFSYFSNEKESKLKLPCMRQNKDTAIITIAQGCLGNCAYCSTKFARGNLVSYSEDEIKQEVENAAQGGCKMIYLTSQDNGCYGIDKNSSLPKLLKKLISIKGNFKMRIGMMNPEHILKFLDELTDVYKNERIMKFLHVPVQSGSDRVLKYMNRKYEVRDFKKIVNKFRKEIPDISISTDIVVGYPTETIEDFEQSIALIKKIKPEVLNISKFAPRPKTPAASLKQLPTQEIKRRSVLLSKVFRSYKL